MIPLLSLLLMIFAAFGGGALILKATGTLDRVSYLEQFVISFTLGIGVIGWGIFFLALSLQIDPEIMIAFLGILVVGLLFIKVPEKKSLILVMPDTWGVGLLVVIFFLLFYDILEGIAPPADADTLAYHFALPKAFLNAGGLFPIYQAIEGTIPLLQQMTYMAALGIGGEQGMTLWTMASGWAATALVFVLAKRFVSTNWALAIALVFLSTPAVLYGAGSGQIEVRNAGFVLVTALAVSEARRTDLLRFAALAGIAAGFFIACKYTGLVFAFSAGLFLLFQKRWLTHGLVFLCALLLTGTQWYGWNLWITGDPIFPLLYGKINYMEGVPWNDTIQEVFKESTIEKPVHVNFFWYLFYPIKATLFADPGFESLRVGFGFFVLSLLPFFFLGVWQYKKKLLNHPLTTFGGLCLVVYTVWFFVGPSQRVRHLLPVYPLLLLCFSVVAIRWAQSRPQPKWMLSLYIVLALVLLLQIMGATLYAANYMQFAFSKESRKSFLHRNVSQYEAAARVNAMLGSESKVLISSRQLVYHIDIPLFYANHMDQAVVEIHKKAHDSSVLWKQLQYQEITHMLLPFMFHTKGVHNNYAVMVQNLKEINCLRVLVQFEVLSISSRTLPTMESSKSPFSLVQLTPNLCQSRPD